MTNEQPTEGSSREQRYARADARAEREANRPKRMALSTKRRKILRWIRIGLVVFAFGALWDIMNHFEFVRLPDGPGECSQILAYEPGITLLVSKDPDQEDLNLDDVVMFSLESGQLTYGRISTPPGLESGNIMAETGYWILGDNPECRTADSTSLGAISFDRIVGRILFPLRF